jgi:DNA polymerase
MSKEYSAPELLSALQGYLEELQETGVEGLPLDLSGSLGGPANGVAEPAASYAPSATSESLDEISSSLGDCQRCALGATRTNLVFGVGNPRARVVFVGEAPGKDEDLKGEPFVGEAGQLLTKIIEAMGFKREEVYICNVLKCRPPKNRDPLPAEVEECGPFMLRQVKAIAPVAIVALGKFAAQTLLQSKTPISKLRGTFHDYHGIPLMPTYHPAALLRDNSLKRDVWSDMQQVMALLAKQAG